VCTVIEVLVVSRPCYTNAAIVARHAPSVPSSNITALIRLDFNRAIAQVTQYSQPSYSSVYTFHVMIVFSVQCPRISYPGSQVPRLKLLNILISDKRIFRSFNLTTVPGNFSPISSTRFIGSRLKNNIVMYINLSHTHNVPSYISQVSQPE